MINILSTQITEVHDRQHRHADIIISDGESAYLWGVGGLPAEGDLQALLAAREAELWRAAQAGGLPYTWAEVRARRDSHLRATDWTQAADAPLSPVQRALWATYRQVLRDIPQRFANPAGVTWPVPPTVVQLRQARLAGERPAFVDDTITLED